jgi:hypothetical protein
MERFLKIDMADIPLVKKAQSVKEIWIGRRVTNGLEEIFSGRLGLIKRGASPQREDMIPHD